MNQNTRHTTVRLRIEQAERLDRQCAALGLFRADGIRQAIERWLTTDNRTPGPQETKMEQRP